MLVLKTAWSVSPSTHVPDCSSTGTFVLLWLSFPLQLFLEWALQSLSGIMEGLYKWLDWVPSF